jgi:hypothetical protein
MTRTSVLALIVGLLATGCVVTTGGKPARTNHVHKNHHRSSSGGAATPAPAPAPAPTTGGAAVAAPPVATPTPAAGGGNTTGGTLGTTPAGVPGYTRVPGSPPVKPGQPAEEEEENKKYTPGSKRGHVPTPAPAQQPLPTNKR